MWRFQSFWWKSQIFMSAKPEVELIFILVSMKNSLNMKYLENSKRHDVGLKPTMGFYSLTLDDLESS